PLYSGRMDETIQRPADEPFFKALLMPHRSLGRTGFLILMGALLFGWVVTGAIFLAHGAWPVFGFCGLDVLAVYLAFQLKCRSAACSIRAIARAWPRHSRVHGRRQRRADAGVSR